MGNICVYFHVNKIKQEIFNIGIGIPTRPYVKIGRSKWWHNITNKYDYEIIIIQKNLTWKKACELEIFYIKQIGRQDLGLGTLINLTDGGEGSPGHKCSDETKKKMSAAGKIHAAKRIGKKLSDETKKKISEALKGNKNCLGNIIPQIVRDKLSLANKGQKRSMEICKKISDSLKGKRPSAESRKKMSLAKKGKIYPRSTKN